MNGGVSDFFYNFFTRYGFWIVMLVILLPWIQPHFFAAAKLISIKYNIRVDDMFYNNCKFAIVEREIDCNNFFFKYLYWSSPMFPIKKSQKLIQIFKKMKLYDTKHHYIVNCETQNMSF